MLCFACASQESVDLIDFETAIDRVIGGLEKKNKVSWGVERCVCNLAVLEGAGSGLNLLADQ